MAVYRTAFFIHHFRFLPHKMRSVCVRVCVLRPPLPPLSCEDVVNRCSACCFEQLFSQNSADPVRYGISPPKSSLSLRFYEFFVVLLVVFFWRRVWLKSDVCVSVVRDPSVLLGEQETNHGPSPFNPVMVSGDPRDLLVIHHFDRKCRVVLSDSESNTWDKIVSTQSWIWVEFVTRLRILSNSTSISSFPTLWCPHAYRCLLWWKWAAVWLWGRILFNGCSIIQYQKEYKHFWQEVDWTHLTLNLKVQGNKSLSRFNSQEIYSRTFQDSNNRDRLIDQSLQQCI